MLLVNLLTHPVFFPAQSQSTHILVSWRLVPPLFALRKFLSGLCGNDAPHLTLENYFVIAALVDAAYQFSIGTISGVAYGLPNDALSEFRELFSIRRSDRPCPNPRIGLYVFTRKAAERAATVNKFVGILFETVRRLPAEADSLRK